MSAYLGSIDEYDMSVNVKSDLCKACILWELENGLQELGCLWINECD